jgi:class 3 adenylate cyclase
MTTPSTCSPKLIHYLLGDPRRDPPITVEEWFNDTYRTMHCGLDGLDEMSISISGSVEEVAFEHACAQLYDSRYGQAALDFRNIAARHQSDQPHHDSSLRVLARLGWGRASNFLRNYANAAHILQRALLDATSIGDDLLVIVARYLQVINQSDGGSPLGDVGFLDAPPPLDAAAPLGNILDAYRVYALSRVKLRAGNRADGLDALVALMSAPPFAELALIPAGLLTRMRGVLEVTCSRHASGLHYLEGAIEIFRRAGYRLGEVHAALSLARAVPADRSQTRIYLERAQKIVEDTDLPNAKHPLGRQMPYERGDLWSRLADFEFAQGDLKKAAELYEKDLHLIEELSPSPMPRAAGYAHRNVGRVRFAQRAFLQAIEDFKLSIAVFDRVGDGMNVFFSRVWHCDALLAAGNRHDEVGAVLRELDTAIKDKPDRSRERAIVDIRRALFFWKRDTEDVRALVLLDSAKGTLARGRDYHYARALLVEAEIKMESHDRLRAKHLLVEARRIAIHDKIEDLRKDVDEHLTRLGLSNEELAHLDEKNELEHVWELRGFTRRKLSILFADIRGFTPACMSIQPIQMAEFIGEFADLASRFTSKFDGHPVRFLGDCVMAIFGVHESTGKEVASIEAARAMHHEFMKLRDRWAHVPELRKVGLGFGISTGEVVPGRFGSASFSEFSVIGEATTLASRLQGCAEDGEIVVCPDTMSTIHDVEPDLPSAARKRPLKGMPEDETLMYVILVSDVLLHLGRQNSQPSVPPRG